MNKSDICPEISAEFFASLQPRLNFSGAFARIRFKGLGFRIEGIFKKGK